MTDGLIELVRDVLDDRAAGADAATITAATAVAAGRRARRRRWIAASGVSLVVIWSVIVAVGVIPDGAAGRLVAAAKAPLRLTPGQRLGVDVVIGSTLFAADGSMISLPVAAHGPGSLHVDRTAYGWILTSDSVRGQAVLLYRDGRRINIDRTVAAKALVSPDGKSVALSVDGSSATSTIKVVDTRTAKMLWTTRAPMMRATSWAGSRLVLSRTGSDGADKVSLWDPARGGWVDDLRSAPSQSVLGDSESRGASVAVVGGPTNGGPKACIGFVDPSHDFRGLRTLCALRIASAQSLAPGGRFIYGTDQKGAPVVGDLRTSTEARPVVWKLPLAPGFSEADAVWEDPGTLVLLESTEDIRPAPADMPPVRMYRCSVASADCQSVTIPGSPRDTPADQIVLVAPVGSGHVWPQR